MKLALRSLLVLVLASMEGACHESNGSSSLPTGTSNLGSEPITIRLEDGVLATEIVEVAVDRNGDGDSGDTLLEIVDLRTGRRELVPNVGIGFSQTVGLGGGFVSFAVPEAAEGRDLNGDGDQDDQVLHVHDARRGSTRNLQLAVALSGLFSVEQDGALVAFGVAESEQGADLDGDGLLNSVQAFVHEADRGRTTQLGLHISSRLHLSSQSPIMAGRRVVLVAEESTSGDLNGDGDAVDHVLHVYDADAAGLQNFGLAVERVVVEGSMLAFVTCECEHGESSPEGSPDLNGNGIAGDSFVVLHDLESGSSRMTPLPPAGIWVGGDLALLRLENGGSPAEIFAYDRFGDALFELGPLAFVFFEPALVDRRAAFAVDELAAGQDLDGDGELLDTVLHTFDARTGALHSSDRATFSPAEIDGHFAVFQALPAPSSVRPPPSTTLVAENLQSGEVQELDLPASAFHFESGRIAAVTPEAWRGADLNGDLDLLDSVVQVHDLATGVTTNTGLAVLVSDTPIVLELEGDFLAFLVPEQDQGTDLNGDQDRLDAVLHVVRLR